MQQAAEEEGQAGPMVALVCYAAPCKCPQCGCHLPGGVEHVRVPGGRTCLEYTADQLVVHGTEGPAVFDRAKVAFVKMIPDRERAPERRVGR